MGPVGFEWFLGFEHAERPWGGHLSSMSMTVTLHKNGKITLWLRTNMSIPLHFNTEISEYMYFSLI